MTRDKILKLAKRLGTFKTQDIVRELHISRQVAASHIRSLVEAGLLTKSGSTKQSVYRLASGAQRPQKVALTMVKALKGLAEDSVFVEVERRLQLPKKLNVGALRIAYYAFSEMLNNAIDHSRSAKAKIEVWLEKGHFKFTISDSGIGAFSNVKKTFHLKDEYVAAEHLFKGKQTTDPSRHTGQGIFFTSRIADVFTIRSHGLKAVVDNENNDIFFSDERPIKGTEVSFSVRTHTRKKLDRLFREFANEEYEFDKNEVRLRLRHENEAISRSQARRLLTGLEKFKRIVFDFDGISGLGQAFADEVFRVFANRHPNILVSYANAKPAVEFMIRRALKADS